jgi:hypothetical protein
MRGNVGEKLTRLVCRPSGAIERNVGEGLIYVFCCLRGDIRGKVAEGRSSTDSSVAREEPYKVMLVRGTRVSSALE